MVGCMQTMLIPAILDQIARGYQYQGSQLRIIDLQKLIGY